MTVTPLEACYRRLDAEFGFDFNPTRPGLDGLAVPWGRASFAHPPQGPHLARWVIKAHEQANQGKTVVLIVPHRPDTAWWRDHITTADEIRHIQERLTGPFPTAVAIWKGKQQG